DLGGFSSTTGGGGAFVHAAARLASTASREIPANGPRRPWDTPIPPLSSHRAPPQRDTPGTGPPMIPAPASRSIPGCAVLIVPASAPAGPEFAAISSRRTNR